MEDVKKIDVRNAQERKRDRVCNMYKQLRKANPEAPVSRLFNIVARELDMTAQGVRVICIKHGFYTPMSKN